MESRLEAVFQELARERAGRTRNTSAMRATKLLDRLLPMQRAFVDDPSTRKAILCPSRAGKSYTLALYLLHTLCTVPRASVLYVAFIRSEAKEIMWQLIKGLDEEFELGLTFGEADLTINTRRGGVARLAGCGSWGDIDKFRGVPRHLVILDESATCNAQLLSDLVYKVIEPRLGDYKGTLVMAGTPGEVLAGPFYDVTGPNAFNVTAADDGTMRAMSRPYAERADGKWRDIQWAWSVHGWPKSANTSEPGQNAWAEALKLKERNGWSNESPIWVREHLGRWIADDSKLVSRYDAGRDDWTPGARTAENPFGLPEGHAWRFVVACDMGFHDPFALQVGAYSDTHPDLHQVYEYEATGLTVTGVADAIRKVHALIDPEDIEIEVGDMQGLGGMVIETLATEHGIYLEPLAQKDKRDHIEMANAGFVDGRIKILRGSRLAQEMLYLAWDVSLMKPRGNQANHNFDAWLGVVRHSRHLDARPALILPKPGTPEFRAERENAEEDRIASREKKRAHHGGGLNDEAEWRE